MSTIDLTSSPEELPKTVKALNEAGKYQEVIGLLPDSLLETCKSADLYAEKAQSYYMLDKIDLSFKAAENAILLDPGQAKAIHYKGNAYYDQKQYDKAIEAYSKAIELGLKFKHTYNGLGNAYKEHKQYAKAIEAYNKAIELDPTFSAPYNGLGNAYKEEKQYDKAIEAYNKAIELNTTSSYPYNGLGNTYKAQKQYGKAIEAYTKAIELNSKYSLPYNGLGNVYYEQKQYDKAIEVYNKVIEINPKYSLPYNGLGNVYYEQKQNDKAFKAYDKAIELDPKFSAPYYNRAMLYFDKKEYKTALVDYTKYVNLTEYNPDFFTSLAKDKISEISKLIADHGYKDIRELVDKTKDLLLFKDDCITHYTSLSSAKALILEGRPFRLSEGTYLNDTSEGRELFNYLSFHTTTFNRARDTAAEQFAKKPFIGSFVAESKHDDLTLWRMYGKEAKEEAKGCAITLTREKFLENLIQIKTNDSNTGASLKTNEEFNFYRVAYKTTREEKQFAIPGASKRTEDLLNTYMKELAEKMTAINKDNHTSETQDILEALNEIAYLFKSAEYQYEHEVRLVIKEIGFDKIISTDLTPPKVQIELTSLKPVLKQITLGPKVDRSDEWASAFYYSLDKEGCHPEILISHLPFK